MMIRNKKAVVGETILYVYRFMLVSIIALVVLGIAAVAYDYYIDVRDVEARILERDVIGCIAGNGLLDLNIVPEKDLLEYCGVKNNDRFYVRVQVFNSSMGKLKVLEHGDSGLESVKTIFEGRGTDKIAKYAPGAPAGTWYKINLKQGENLSRGNIFVEAIVSYES